MASRVRVAAIACAVGAWCGARSFAQAPITIPRTDVSTLSGQHLVLPNDLPAPATVLILGFGRDSQDATTAWERPTRLQLAKPGTTGFYDMAMLAEIPSILRPFIVRAIKRKVPEVLQPNFIPLTEGEDQWKRAAGYVQDQPDAAYVLLVDRSGIVRWSTHAAFTPAAFHELQRHVDAVVHSNP